MSPAQGLGVSINSLAAIACCPLCRRVLRTKIENCKNKPGPPPRQPGPPQQHAKRDLGITMIMETVSDLQLFALVLCTSAPLFIACAYMLWRAMFTFNGDVDAAVRVINDSVRHPKSLGRTFRARKAVKYLVQNDMLVARTVAHSLKTKHQKRLQFESAFDKGMKEVDGMHAVATKGNTLYEAQEYFLRQCQGVIDEEMAFNMILKMKDFRVRDAGTFNILLLQHYKQLLKDADPKAAIPSPVIVLFRRMSREAPFLGHFRQ